MSMYVSFFTIGTGLPDTQTANGAGHHRNRDGVCSRWDHSAAIDSAPNPVQRCLPDYAPTLRPVIRFPTSTRAMLFPTHKAKAEFAVRPVVTCTANRRCFDELAK